LTPSTCRVIDSWPLVPPTRTRISGLPPHDELLELVELLLDDDEELLELDELLLDEEELLELLLEDELELEELELDEDDELELLLELEELLLLDDELLEPLSPVQVGVTKLPLCVPWKPKLAL
jgi:hypothetical protein